MESTPKVIPRLGKAGPRYGAVSLQPSEGHRTVTAPATAPRSFFVAKTAPAWKGGLGHSAPQHAEELGETALTGSPSPEW